MDKTSVWQASKLMMALPTDAGRTRIPTLQVRDPTMKHILREAADNADKGQLLYKTFFPKTNPNLTPSPVGYRYPPPQWMFQNITDQQIHQAIKRMKLYKASRSGLVTNSVLIYTRELLVPHLRLLF